MADPDPIPALIERLRALAAANIGFMAGEFNQAADALAALTAQLHENPPHKITGLKDGKAIHASDCYACERNGLQERIRFTADYETLRTQLHEVTERRWQPIETAPKDGTRVYVYGCHYQRHWFGTGYYFKGVPGDGEGWIAHSSHVSPVNDCGGSFEPTHWMPLPPPPPESPPPRRPAAARRSIASVT